MMTEGEVEHELTKPIKGYLQTHNRQHLKV